MKKSVLFIAKNLHWGGAELSLLHLIKCLREIGVTSSLIAGADGDQRTAFEQTCESVLTVPLPYRRKPLTWVGAPKFLSKVDFIARKIAPPSLVLANDFYETFACQLAARFTGCQKAGAIWQSSYTFEDNSDVKKWFQQGATHMQVLMASEVVASHMNSQLGNGFHVRTLNPFIEETRFDPARYDRNQIRHRLGWNGRHVGVVVGAITRSDGKGQIALVKAFVDSLKKGESSPKQLLCLVGPADTEATAEIHRSTSQFEENIRLLGPRTDIPKIFAASDLALFPGRIPESFGLSLIEARLMNRHVIALENSGAVKLHNGAPNFRTFSSLPQITAAWREVLDSPPLPLSQEKRQSLISQYGKAAFTQNLREALAFLFM
jgi:glycosyltransferase involved in cell wall biosynthesis